MDTSLHDYLKTLPHGRLPEVQVKNFMYEFTLSLSNIIQSLQVPDPASSRLLAHASSVRSPRYVVLSSFSTPRLSDSDIKPENLLLKGETTIKLADFGAYDVICKRTSLLLNLKCTGLARDLSETHPLSMYVSTRWYASRYDDRYRSLADSIILGTAHRRLFSRCWITVPL
jgi:serine/threonine protein kinase